MRKKFFSAVLMGTFLYASMGMFVSCKDYDDDINGLRTQVNDLETLKAAKADVESSLNSLRAQLEAKDGELQAAISKNSGDIAGLMASVASLESRIQTAENAISAINEILAGKVDKSEYDLKITEIMGLISAVSSDLAAKYADLNAQLTAQAAVDADLQQQINALNTLIETLKNSNTSGSQELLNKIEELKEELVQLINNKTSDIAGIKTNLQQMSDRIDSVLSEINVLNVFVKSSLRGLVFVPDAYYWGIEATKMLFLENDNYDIASAAYNKKETKGYTDHTRYETSKYTKVLDFVATYHMNPSNADKNEFKTVAILDNDVDYINTRSSVAGLSVKDWNVAEGLLNVNINVSDPTKIKTVLGDKQVTNFATQVTIAKGDRDTTITSDYATLFTENIKDLVLCHKAGSDVPFLDVKNTHESECPVANHVDNGRLMQTAYEAHHDFGAQDFCYWNSTLDLRKLVETHYTTTDGKHAVLDIEKYGMKYVFELTGLYYGDNETSESAHSAIATDGYTFRPQMVAENGEQQAYGAEQNRATTVGRTPLVRVSLVDVNDASVVYDYGYIRIKIADPALDPEEKADEYIEYTGQGWTYNYECTPKGWSFSTTWNVTEYDLYNKIGVTREEFEANYGAPVYKTGTSGDLKQYTFNATTKKFAEADANHYYGTVTTITDVTSTVEGIKTSTLKWNITGSDAKKYFVDQKMEQIITAIKYESKNKIQYPDVYVMFKTGEPINIIKPSGDLTWEPIKNPKYWYASNTNNEGTDEIHNNVLTPEDNASGKGDKMVQKFSAVMLGNNIDAAKIITVNDDNTGEYATSKLSLDMIFSSKNEGKAYKGNDGNTYVIGVSANGKELTAKLGIVEETIAKISSDADVNEQKIEYVRESVFAQELLNYAAHNKLADDVVKAIVTTTAANKCPMPLELDNETFDVRFLRPINVFNTNKPIQDADTGELQVIKLHDMVTFTDWRDAWKPADGLHGDYCDYYGITGIEVEDVADGDYISSSDKVLTNQSGAWDKLKNVNSQLDFKYDAGTGHESATLTYKNFSSTVQEFQVEIPIVVSYYWGKIRTKVTITVQKTSANAKKH